MAIVQEKPARVQHVALPIRELGCAANAPSIEHTLRKIPGVSRVYVNPVTEMAYVEFDPSVCDESAIAAALKRAGFGALHHPTERRRWL